MSEISVTDRLAVEALVTEYAWRLDHRDWDRLWELFTPEAYLKIRGREILGHEGIRAWAEARATRERRRTQHQMTNVHLVPGTAADELAGSASLVLHVAKSGGNGTYVDLVGEYQDEYVRVGGDWLFRRRVLVPVSEF